MPTQVLDAPAFSYPNLQFLPYKHPEKARQIVVNLPALATYAKGQIIVQATSAANDVQTFTATGIPAGGTFTYTVTNPLTGQTSSLVIPYNATAAALQTLATAIYGTGNITAGGGPWPGTALTLTGAGLLAGVAIPIAVAGTNAFTGGTAPSSSVAKTTTGRSLGTFSAYTGTGTTGLAILQNDVSTDAGGNITFGPVAGLSRWGQSYPTAPAWVGGVFRTIGMIGLDANAVTYWGAHFETGTIADGVLVIPT